VGADNFNVRQNQHVNTFSFLLRRKMSELEPERRNGAGKSGFSVKVVIFWVVLAALVVGLYVFDPWARVPGKPEQPPPSATHP
jgi:hypothetical protein